MTKGREPEIIEYCESSRLTRRWNGGIHKISEGQRKLSVGGFIFARNKSGADNKEICLCQSTGCRARVHTLQNNIITYVEEHNHSLLHGDKDVYVIRSAINRRAVQGEERSTQVSAICVKYAKGYFTTQHRTLKLMRIIICRAGLIMNISLHWDRLKSHISYIYIYIYIYIYCKNDV